jgi:hypothetical protein
MTIILQNVDPELTEEQRTKRDAATAAFLSRGVTLASANSAGSYSTVDVNEFGFLKSIVLLSVFSIWQSLVRPTNQFMPPISTQALIQVHVFLPQKIAFSSRSTHDHFFFILCFPR